jgi:hypothetical protein
MKLRRRNFRIENVNRNLNLYEICSTNVFESNESSESKHTLSSFGARLKITTFDVRERMKPLNKF